MVKFDSFSLRQPVLASLAEMGFEEASPIQSAMIPILMAGKDAVGQAQTGTGKTAAFGIPLVEHAMNGVPALVLVPTRELAAQVAAEIDRIGKHAGITALVLAGGAAFGPQARALQSGDASIIVATPGRLRDHIERGTLAPESAGCVVLDEADEMLDMGFLEEVEIILEAVGPNRQTMLFSATMPEPIKRLAERFLKNPEFVSVAGENGSVATAQTEQLAIAVMHHEKLDTLVRILAAEQPTGVLVFRHTREMVDDLVMQLRGKGFPAEALHGGMPQAMRDSVLARFRDGRAKILVATNVAARGLDVDTISHVVNYDAPAEAEAYVHRIGRTGRAGREGRSYLFVTPADRGRLRGIERVLQARLVWAEVPTDEQVHAAIAQHTATWLAAQTLQIQPGHRAIIDDLVAKGADPAALAAKLLGLVAKHEGLVAPPLDARRAQQRQHASSQHAPSRREREPRGEPTHGGLMVSIAINVGRDDGVRPGDIVGAFANEGGLTGGEIGRIDILPRMSVIEVPVDRVEEVADNMRATSIRGRPLSIRPAKDWQFRNAPKPGMR
ncbi:MAG: ATP-dependent helicase DeaD [Thermoplasmata archaeon]|jgi:ATP-dependent RNA helicase DeaD|nr:ATP-dependent helicase DeaD [Thermoplasmata archaeon]